MQCCRYASVLIVSIAVALTWRSILSDAPIVWMLQQFQERFPTVRLRLNAIVGFRSQFLGTPRVARKKRGLDPRLFTGPQFWYREYRWHLAYHENRAIITPEPTPPPHCSLAHTFSCPEYPRYFQWVMEAIPRAMVKSRQGRPRRTIV